MIIDCRISNSICNYFHFMQRYQSKSPWYKYTNAKVAFVNGFDYYESQNKTEFIVSYGAGDEVSMLKKYSLLNILTHFNEDVYSCNTKSFR